MLGDGKPCAPKEIDENSAARSLRGGQAVTGRERIQGSGEGGERMVAESKADF